MGMEEEEEELRGLKEEDEGVNEEEDGRMEEGIDGR